MLSFSQRLRSLSGNFFATVDAFIADFIEEAYLEPEHGFRMILSESWIFELIWKDLVEQEPEDVDVLRLRQEDCIAVDWSLLDLRDREEIDIFVHILGAVVQDSLRDVFLGNEMTLSEAKKLFHERLDCLRRHFEKRGA